MSNGGVLGLAGPARVYDCLLGGKDNYAVDRELVRELLRIEPGLVDAARANRAFVRRAVRELAGLGLRQFLDIGCGLPTNDNVHQIASRHMPGARVLYVDQDPLVLVHARALLVDDGDVAALQADLRKPEDLVAQALDHGLLDPSEPIGVLVTSVLHHLTDADDPWHTVRTLTAALPPGSVLVISHLTNTPTEPAPGTPTPPDTPPLAAPPPPAGIPLLTEPPPPLEQSLSRAASTPAGPRTAGSSAEDPSPEGASAEGASAATGSVAADASVSAAVAARYTEGCSLPLVPRDPAAILSLLDGLELLSPGFVPVEDWRPEISAGTPSEPSLYLAAAATIPH
ncbi:SAM-dependent methyltransferase [Actinomadura oligospora]|uniref:SAM-dependent methyltransferase n=1 Tax=Actinomadura oligospora TaxID=111804 RepID=UPI0004B83FB8|nr:SAM-dependent methyltransferase [Actinomadura oligospora]